MVKNYFKVAIRSLMRNKVYTSINIIGLAVGIATCVLIGLFVKNEVSFDDNVLNSKQIYRLNEYVHYDGTAPSLSAAVGPPIAPFLQASHNEISNYSRVFPAVPFIYPSITLEYNGKKIKTDQIACTDTSFADFFNVKFISGNKANFIKTQNSITLTKSLAHKLFGNESALNKTIVLHKSDTSATYFVVGSIIADMPQNSHMQIEGLLPIPDEFLKGYLGDNYGILLGPTYVKIADNKNIAALEQKLTKSIHIKNTGIDIRLQPLSQIHAQSVDINYDYYNYNKIDGKYINIFIIIALAVFLIGCVNFINLTIAIAGYRGKEIAIKKIIGAKRTQIVLQVLTETLVSVLMALFIAVGLIAAFLPALNKLVNRELTMNTLYQHNNLLLFAAILVFTTLLAGAYPAILISSAKINKALKSKVLFGSSKSSLRNVLVTGQLVIAVVFMISLIVITQQLKYLQQKDLGFAYTQIIKIPLDTKAAEKLTVVRSDLAKINGVVDVTNGYMELGGNGGLYGIDYKAPNGEAKHISVNMENAAPNYIDFFKMKLIAGETFNKNPSNQYLINETLAKQIGYANPVGKQINLSGGFDPGVIVGVVKDFNYSNLHSKIEPLIISSVDMPVWQTQLYIKVLPANISGTLKVIEQTMKRVTDDDQFSYEFMDEHFKQVYQSDQQVSTMIAIIGGLALFISSLGLLSLAAFVALRRKKEIGVRKVLGASVINITATLSKEFVNIVLIAFIIASAIGWYTMNMWLENFSYRIAIQWWMFVFAGILSLTIVLITISFQTIRAALANPVNSLKNE
ncbi:ABC transporter permease [Mucilaginibacter segetis]|uniref:ABC transporter permease n=1 Tax=Mucilaginibacter segetis TaxID=2793071 RepID=A0A934PTK5_9SPHI|nr:ABC transporter permease [Mucilaginibacter segetis]MBK0379170.1 ABC transporter permease [Mucilaginibacter segetis]